MPDLAVKKFNEIFSDELQVRRLNVMASSGYIYPTTSKSSGQKWPSGLSASGASPNIDNYTMRHNARNAFHDSLQARAIVERLTDTIVDVGIKLDSKPIASILGISDEQAELWSDEVNQRFNLWAASKKCHRARTMNFYQAQRLTGLFQHRDNDYFVRLWYSAKRDLLNPLQFAFIDPDQIRGDAIVSTSGFQNMSGDGIERDADGREIAYNVYVRKTGNLYDVVRIPAYGARSGLPLMIHGYQPEYAFQGRGYSRLGAALQEFENLTDFELSHIKKAIAQSAITMFVKPAEDEPASNPFADITKPVSAGAYAGGITDDPEEPMDSGSAGLYDYSYVPVPEATFKVPGSMAMVGLDSGEELEPFRDTTPSQEFGRFVDSFSAYLCAAEGIPIEVLLMRFNQNYSASRATLLLFWRLAMRWRAEMQTDFLDPIYEAWLTGEIASGRISAPGWSDPRMRAAWCNAIWIGAPMPNIDPQRTAKADEIYVKMGAQDLDRVAREYNGSDGKSNRQRLIRQYGEIEMPPWEEDKSGSDAEDKENETED